MPLRPEDRLQSRVRMYLDDALPAPGWWSSVDHARKQSLKSGQIQKARGIKRGLCDVAIWYLGMFYGIELKAGKNDTSDAQDGFGVAMVATGFRYQVIRSVEALDLYLRNTGIPILPSMRVAAMQHDAALWRCRRVPRPSVPASRAATRRRRRARRRCGRGACGMGCS